MTTANAERGRNAPVEAQGEMERHATTPPAPFIRVRLDLGDADEGRGAVGTITAAPGRVRECSIGVAADGTLAIDFALAAPSPGRVYLQPGRVVRLPDEADYRPEPPAGWVAVASNVDRSPDGRFEIETGGRQMHTVRDLWTGEEVRGLATRPAAEQWCKVRGEGARLTWWQNADVWEAGGTDHEQYFVRPNSEGQWIGIDNRFPHGERLRGSPDFNTPEAAKRWCEIRAACEVEGGPGSRTLRYDSPIPF